MPEQPGKMQQEKKACGTIQVLQAFYLYRKIHTGTGNSSATDAILRRYRKQSLRRLWIKVPLRKSPPLVC